MKRRTFMMSAAGAAAGLALAPRMSFAAAGTIDWYTSSDTNILDFWSNTIKPAFEAANPGLKLNLVDAGDGAGIIAIEQAEAGGCAEDMGSARQLDQGQSGSIRLQPPRQRRFGRQFRSSRHPSGERP